jgi:hypothetical protein
MMPLGNAKRQEAAVRGIANGAASVQELMCGVDFHLERSA